MYAASPRTNHLNGRRLNPFEDRIEDVLDSHAQRARTESSD